MVSTISAELEPETDMIDAIKRTFPMGSMTGAPKVKAMELSEKYENTKRGMFSGAIGYFSPDNDFDFNVVIRSILYNSTRQYLSYMVGSAITAKSIPCLAWCSNILNISSSFMSITAPYFLIASIPV